MGKEEQQKLRLRERFLMDQIAASKEEAARIEAEQKAEEKKNRKEKPGKS